MTSTGTSPAALDLAARKRELLAHLLKAQGLAAGDQGIPRRSDPEAPGPLSFAQRRLWFLEQLEPGSPLYNISAALRLTGPLDVGILEKSLGEILRRHSVLRTRFVEGDGEPRQEIAPWEPVSLSINDLTGLPEPERAPARSILIKEEAQRPFHLGRGPLVRLGLLRWAADDHALLITMHHAVADGWSAGILVRELAALYEAFREGRPSPLPEPELQYADVAAWQRERLQGDVLRSQLEHWRQQLDGVPPVLELPTDRPRPPVQTFHGARRQQAFPLELGERLRALGQRENATLFMVLLAGFQALLHRYTGQSRIPVGAPIAGRNRAELEGLIGLFTNTLVLQTDLAGDPSFRELVRRARTVVLAADAHQDLPFERLVEDLDPQRDASRSPLFQVAFSFQQPQMPAIDLSRGLVLRPAGVESEVAKFDLTLYVTDAPQGLFASIEYNTDLFDGSTVERMLGHYRRLMEGAASAPDSRLSTLPLLHEEEHRRVVVEWNRTERPLAGALVHERFAAQAARRPEALAAAFGGEQLSYGELDRRTNQLARRLRRQGVGPEVRVGLCVERGLDLVVGALAVLKAGGAYVALDSELPSSRLEYMLRDAAVAVVLTERSLREKLETSGVARLCLDDEALAQSIAGEEATAFASGVQAQNLAYVIYTSGSTGLPKGVELTHEGLGNLVSWHVETYAVTESDRATQVAGLGFDASVWELWPYLSSGASVHFVEEEARRVPRRLQEWLGEERITLSFLPTPVAEPVLSEDWGSGRELRALLTGGDRLRRHPGKALGFDLVNHYGPTENTVVATAGVVAAGAEGVPTIGRPIANVRVYVLDAVMNPVPMGVGGELYIGGRSLARGYVGRPDLTAERFVPDAFAAEPGGRLYRTGDRVRYRETGEIEFLGRLDGQVKVRGHRIELGEIETVLSQHAWVRQCAVVVRQERPGERLVAYVVSRPEEPGSVAALRQHLREKLPEYMVPSAFEVLDALPLTPNGKLDREALPSPAGGGALGFVAPRTSSEEILAGIFAEVLRGGPVGADDSFFDLGGHSLLATQIVSRAQNAFDREVPLRWLFESPTVAGLADRLDAARASAAPLPIVPVPHEGGLPLSFGQQRLWLLEQFEPGSGLYIVAGAVRLVGALDVDALQRSLSEIVARHETLRTRFERNGGQTLQVVEPAPDWRLGLEDLAGLGAEEREEAARRRANEEATRPFDLHRGPLFRATLLGLDPTQHLLVLAMHHVVSDAWSLGVLVRELAALYAGHAAGRPVTLPELPVQYADYAVWQRESLQGQGLEEPLGYWRTKLAGMPPSIDLPSDHPRPLVPTRRGGAEQALLPAELGTRLGRLARQEGATLFMVLLAAFKALLARYSGRTDVVVGSPIANRARPEVEGLIGFFVNTLVLRTDLAGDPAFRELLARVRETALGAFSHQELPFDRLVEELNPERTPGHHPLFQVAFALHNTPRASLELPGLRLVPQELGGGGAKFDLTLTLAESAHGLGATLEYSADLFEPATAERLLGHYQRLLDGAAADPGTRLSALPLLSDDERQRVVREWNRTRTDYPRAGLHELFEAQARRTPDAVAVVFGDLRLTYAELDARSNQLARHLRGLGVRAEDRVGLCLERSAALVVATLGILKAGAAYLPLDPSYPSDRLRFMQRDGGVEVVVSEEAFRSRLPEDVARVVALDTDRAAIEAQDTATLAHRTDPEGLAYVIYTSGSTGEPKGVCVSHRAVCRLVLDTDYVRFGGGEVVAQASNASFDAATFEIWGPLLSGDRLVGVRREVTLEPRELARDLREQGVTVLFLTTALFNLLARDAPGALSGLRTVLFGGEAVDTRWVKAVLDHGMSGRLLHVYGPTETTTFATWHHVEGVGGHEETVPIGRPIANSTAYVLDRCLEPVPVGVEGELYLGGDGLARGYWKRPDLTAERFVPDPFGERPGQRLYRTGDRVRRRADGAIEFLGRIDHQVKLRGFRIELGEIEAALGRHPSVREAAVLAREDAPGDRRLVAYVAWEDGGGTTWAELRQHLRQRLPDYMVPSVLVEMPALPLNPNGKVDRRALQAPERRSEGAALELDGGGEAERKVAAVWREVLGLEQVGLDESFFDLGGHSLLLVEVHGRLRALFPERDLKVLQLFEHPTVRSLGALLGGPPASSPTPAAEVDEPARREEGKQRLARRRAVRAGGSGGGPGNA